MDETLSISQPKTQVWMEHGASVNPKKLRCGWNMEHYSAKKLGCGWSISQPKNSGVDGTLSTSQPKKLRCGWNMEHHPTKKTGVNGTWRISKPKNSGVNETWSISKPKKSGVNETWSTSQPKKHRKTDRGKMLTIGLMVIPGL